MTDGPKGGRGRWSELGVPHRGWTCVGTEDLGKPTNICDMCQTSEIRYVHYMEHPDYPLKLACGEICAGHMEGDLIRASGRDKSMKDLARRRHNFPNLSGWRVNAKGNHVLKKDGAQITVFKKGNFWSGAVSHPFVNNRQTQWTSGYIDDLLAAKLATFDILQEVLKAAKERTHRATPFDPFS